MSKESALHAQRVNQTVRNASEAPRGLGDERFLRSRQRSHEFYRLAPSRIPNHPLTSDTPKGSRQSEEASCARNRATHELTVQS